MVEPPDGISLERNRDLSGMLGSPLYRRALLSCIAVLPVLALLGVFGQRPTTTSANTPAVDVKVTAPARLRSGLIFQVRVQVSARRQIRDLKLVFDQGWWESMSVNAIVPEPTEESSEDGQVVLDYGKLPTGEKLVCWIYFQTNPTNVGDRREDLDIRDGSTLLAHIHRSMTVFP